ncbi:L-fucose:H+ symporter permease [Flavisolibacter ginsenosidimutans]|uniref:L-fucose:H+ symporter permease n=1 Tax=Flavisolibacter ginsenosidimutans TaxID=661481 RepID=A0A5B8UH11_9BACT|nr:L-fucose:H+ symporter permease [Flavisolibacter ginsenosidimutans]QEC55655.1 L-fucose:H+ symporter permease [Flavisolibacter ginsenosidimutans]
MAQLPIETVSQAVTNSSNGNATNKKLYLIPFILVISLFFLWGMVHNLDSILIPHLKKACELNNRQSTLIDTAVYLAYFLMAIPAGMLVKKWGYKKGIIGGLCVAAAGALLFYPAANARSFELFLFALFIIGCGIATLETAANPYAAVLGPQESAGIRLNLAAAFNGSAAFVAAIVGRTFILSGIEKTKNELASMSPEAKLAYLNTESSAVKIPYLVLAGGFVLVAVLFSLFHFPEVKSESKSAKLSQFAKAFRHKHLTWAVIAQFFYVGAQVCITSFFIRMAKQGGGIDEKAAAAFLGVYGFLFMGGRFIGTFFLKFIKQQKLLLIYAVICTALCATAILIDGKLAVYALCGLGFFVSIMFPTIFSLGIVDLGEDTKIGSSLLIMSIIGGAIFPYIMGTIIDLSGDKIQPGYIVPLLCFLVIIYFSLKGYKPREHEKPVVLS